MGKIKEKKNKLNRFIIFSILFHILLFSLIIFSSLNQIINFINYDQDHKVIDTIIVDTGYEIEKYKKFEQKNNAKQDVIEQKYFQQKKNEQKKLKIPEENNIKIKEKTEKYHWQTKEDIKKTKTKEQNKITKDIAVKVKVKQDKLIKDEIKIKLKDEKILKVLKTNRKINIKKESVIVDDLIDELTVKKPIEKTRYLESNNQKENKKNKVLSSELINYSAKIKAAIENKFYDANIYQGKICELKINLNENGTLISIFAKNNILNDKSLCDAAIRATKTARIPKPPNRSIYDLFNKYGSVIIFNII
ncbi:MAG: cell envelope integrity protein TolA [Arsenophonus sp.]